jgi:hypothetical protein
MHAKESKIDKLHIMHYRQKRAKFDKLHSMHACALLQFTLTDQCHRLHSMHACLCIVCVMHACMCVQGMCDACMHAF